MNGPMPLMLAAMLLAQSPEDRPQLGVGRVVFKPDSSLVSFLLLSHLQRASFPPNCGRLKVALVEDPKQAQLSVEGSIDGQVHYKATKNDAFSVLAVISVVLGVGAASTGAALYATPSLREFGAGPLISGLVLGIISIPFFIMSYTNSFTHSYVASLSGKIVVTQNAKVVERIEAESSLNLQSARPLEQLQARLVEPIFLATEKALNAILEKACATN